MSKARVRQLLETRLLAWAQTQGLGVSVENVPFTSQDTYLEAFVLPAETGDAFVEGGHRSYIGVFQVSIRAPLNQGAGPASLIADALDVLFPTNLRLNTVDGTFSVQVTSPVSEGPGFQPRAGSRSSEVGDTHYVVPTSFTYRADTTT